MTKEYQIIDHAQDACLVVTSKMVVEISETKAGHGHICKSGKPITRLYNAPFTDVIIDILKHPKYDGGHISLYDAETAAVEVEEIMLDSGRWNPDMY